MLPGVDLIPLPIRRIEGWYSRSLVKFFLLGKTISNGIRIYSKMQLSSTPTLPMVGLGGRWLETAGLDLIFQSLELKSNCLLDIILNKLSNFLKFLLSPRLIFFHGF